MILVGSGEARMQANLLFFINTTVFPTLNYVSWIKKHFLGVIFPLAGGAF